MVKRVIKYGTGFVLFLLMTAFTLPPYEEGEAVVGGDGYITEEQEVEIQALYDENKEESGIGILTVFVENEEEEDLSTVAQGVMSEWGLSKTALYLIDTTKQTVTYDYTPDIKESLDNTAQIRDRLVRYVQKEDYGAGIKQLHETFPTDRVEVDETVETGEGGGSYGETTLDTGSIQTQIGGTYDATFEVFDWIALGVMGAILLGGTIYGMIRYRYTKSIQKDIDVFEEYILYNYSVDQEDLWGKLVEQEKIKHTYEEYRNY